MTQGLLNGVLNWISLTVIFPLSLSLCVREREKERERECLGDFFVCSSVVVLFEIYW